MVDRQARSELAICLLRLVTGEMTNGEFDDRYEAWEDSNDAAVAEISTFGWQLYSDTNQYRLKGWHAVSDELRQMADRALLFLQTDLDYEWPRNVKGVVPFVSLWGPGCYLVIGMIVLFAAVYCPNGWEGLFLGIFGLLAIMPTFHWLFTHRNRTEQLKRFYESGDSQVWPFLRKADFQDAHRCAPHEGASNGSVGRQA
jgi:hypothetical protein